MFQNCLLGGCLKPDQVRTRTQLVTIETPWVAHGNLSLIRFSFCFPGSAIRIHCFSRDTIHSASAEAIFPRRSSY